MGTSDRPALRNLAQSIEALEAASVDARSATREAHEARADLAIAIRDAELRLGEMRAAMTTAIDVEVERRVGQEVARQLAELGRTTKKEIDRAASRINGEFRRLEMAIFGRGHKDDLRRQAGLACPACGVLNDAALSTSGDSFAEPSAGDISVCFNCGALSSFTGEGVQRRAATEAERFEAMSRPEISAIVAKVRKAG